MVTMFGRQRTEGGLDARIAELSARRARVDGTAEPANTALRERPAAPVLAGQIAAQLLALYAAGDRAVDVDAAVDRGWTAIAAATADDPDPLVRP